MSFVIFSCCFLFDVLCLIYFVVWVCLLLWVVLFVWGVSSCYFCILFLFESAISDHAMYPHAVSGVLLSSVYSISALPLFFHFFLILLSLPFSPPSLFQSFPAYCLLFSSSLFGTSTFYLRSLHSVPSPRSVVRTGSSTGLHWFLVCHFLLGPPS